MIQRTRDLEKAHERLKIIDTNKNEFLDVIAHELKTPTTSVLAIGQLAINNLADPCEQKELMEIFKDSIGLQIRMVFKKFSDNTKPAGAIPA
jgi:signal transduction histidine kinase